MTHSGLMLDVARNAVRNVETIKKIVDISKELKFDRLYLYLEDVFEIEGEPYFGYLRGKYSLKELKEVDDYAFNKGITVIPCIQTLAHLNQIFRWGCYQSINDVNDILLVDEPKTYEFIDKMFATIQKTFRSRYINAGMDEAFMLGHGQYFKKHGYVDSTEIYYSHLNKVLELAKKYGFTLSVWSDMFFRTAGHSDDYYNTKVKFDEEALKTVPSELTLIYWDYYHEDKKTYKDMLKAHHNFKNKIVFASGIWTWTGFVPSNKFAFKIIKPGIEAAKEDGIDEIILTAWGDNGAECPIMAALPSIFYSAGILNGWNMEKIKAEFLRVIGVNFDDFMKLDLPNILDKKQIHVNPSKYLLYNDPFLGACDSTVNEGDNAKYLSIYRKLSRLTPKLNQYQYLGKMYASLSKVLSIKAELGLNTRKIYLSKDKELLADLIKDYDKCIKYLKQFINNFRNAWFTENHPHGFDVEDIRLGGLLMRLMSSRDRLEELKEGKISSIRELDESILDIDGKRKDDHKKEVELINAYTFNASGNII